MVYVIVRSMIVDHDNAKRQLDVCFGLFQKKGASIRIDACTDWDGDEIGGLSFLSEIRHSPLIRKQFFFFFEDQGEELRHFI